MDDLRQRAIAMAQSYCVQSSAGGGNAQRSGTPPPVRQRTLMPAAVAVTAAAAEHHSHPQQSMDARAAGGSGYGVGASPMFPMAKGGQQPARRPPPVPAEAWTKTPPPPPHPHEASGRDDQQISFLRSQIEAMRHSRSPSSAVEQQQQRRAQQQHVFDPVCAHGGMDSILQTSSTLTTATSPGTRRRAIVNPAAHFANHQQQRGSPHHSSMSAFGVPQSRVPQSGGDARFVHRHEANAPTPKQTADHRSTVRSSDAVPLFSYPPPATTPPPPPYVAADEEASPQLLSPNSEERPDHIPDAIGALSRPQEIAPGALEYDEPTMLLHTSTFHAAVAAPPEDHPTDPTRYNPEAARLNHNASWQQGRGGAAPTTSAVGTPADRVLVAVTQRVNDIETKLSALQGVHIRAHANASLELDKARRSASNAEYRLVELAASVDASIASLQERVASRLTTQRQLRDNLSTRWSTSIRRALQELPLELRQASNRRSGGSWEDTELSVDALLTALHQYDTQNDMRLVSLMHTFMDVQRAARQRINAAEVVVNARNTTTTSAAANAMSSSAKGLLMPSGLNSSKRSATATVDVDRAHRTEQHYASSPTSASSPYPNPNADASGHRKPIHPQHLPARGASSSGSSGGTIGTPKVIASMHEMLQQFVVQTRSQLAELRRDRRAFEEHFITRVASLTAAGVATHPQQRDAPSPAR